MSSAAVRPALMPVWNNCAMSKRYWIFNAAIALAAGFGGVLVGRMLAQPQMPSLEAGTAMPPRPVGGFILTDAKGATTTARDLAGHPTLVFFGFTHCPDVCPTTLALLAGVQKQAAREEPRLATLVQLLGDESRERRPARDVVLERLLEVLLIEALRSPGEQAVVSPGLAQGLADPRLSVAIRALHADPTRPWTVAAMAKEAFALASAKLPFKTIVVHRMLG